MRLKIVGKKEVIWMPYVEYLQQRKFMGTITPEELEALEEYLNKKNVKNKDKSIT